jgi:hypothetical protein
LSLLLDVETREEEIREGENPSFGEESQKTVIRGKGEIPFTLGLLIL